MTSRADVIANPRDTDLRRRFACRNDGDPGQARVVAIEDVLAASTLEAAARRTLADERETLIARHGHTWEPQLAQLANARVRSSPLLRSVGFELGFASHVGAWAERLGDRLEQLAETGCTSLSLMMAEPGLLRRLTASALLPRLRGLHLMVTTDTSDDLLVKLLCAPELAQLEQLELSNVMVTPALATAIAQLEGLRELTITARSEAGALGPGVAATLAELDGLRSLSLSSAELDGKAIARLLDARFVPQLERLSLNRAKPGAGGCKALGSAQLDALTELDLSESNLGKHTPTILANPALAKLERLNLDATRMAKHLTALLDALDIPSLRSLRLGGLRLKEAGAEQLVAGAAAISRCGIVELSLAANALGDDGAEALAACDHFDGIRKLRLDHNGIRAPGIEALSDAPLLRGLEILDLSSNKIQTKGAQALATTVAAATLRELDIDHNWIGNKGAQAMFGEHGLLALERVYFNYENNFGDAGLAALTDSPIRLHTLICGNLGSRETLDRYLRSPAAERLHVLQAYFGVDAALARALSVGELAAKLHTVYIDPNGLDASVTAAMNTRFAFSLARGSDLGLDLWPGLAER